MGTKNLNSATDMITFTRASGGTALRKVSYGSELVTNSDFATNLTGWTDISINGGSVVQSSGVAVMTSVVSGTGARMYQDVTTVVGKLYQLHVNRLSGVSIVQAPNFQSRNASGATTHAFVATSTTSRITLIVYNAGICQVDDVSVKEATLDQADGTLQLFNSPTNIPRIEYSADGTVKGLLIEEARTNKALYSQDFTNSNWNKYLATVTSNATTAPDGTNYAYSVVSQGSGGAVYKTVNASGSHTWSIFAKAFSTSYLKLRSSNTGEDTSFNLSGAGSVGTSNSNHTASIESVGNGWYRCVVTSNSTNNRFTIYPVASDDASGASGNSLYIWGAQLEAGIFPTSYIPTTDVTVTRAADFASIPVDNFGYNKDAGSVVLDVQTPPEAQLILLAYFNTSTYINSRGFLKAASSGNGIGNVFSNESYDGSSTKLNLPSPLANSKSTKLGLSYKDNEVGVRDGGTVISGTGRSTNPTTLHMAGRENGFQSQCWIKSIKYYPRRLSNTQLQELTT